MIYDLHTHSTASDGVLSPTTLVERAKNRKVDVLALTDHDILSGLEEAFTAAQQHNIKLIAGVEISISWRQITFHMLGLGIDPCHQALQLGLQALQKTRWLRAEEMAHSLAAAGIPNTLEGAASFSNGDNLTRTHFARHLVQLGKASSMREVFRRYLVPGRPGYAPVEWASVASAIGWVRAAGGIAVLAHPGRYRIKNSLMRQFLAEFAALGGAGIEVVHGECRAEMIRNNARLARKFNLLASLGSDFHDPALAPVDLGGCVPFPQDLVPIWSAEPLYSHCLSVE